MRGRENGYNLSESSGHLCKKALLPLANSTLLLTVLSIQRS